MHTSEHKRAWQLKIPLLPVAPLFMSHTALPLCAPPQSPDIGAALRGLWGCPDASADASADASTDVSNGANEASTGEEASSGGAGSGISAAREGGSSLVPHTASISHGTASIGQDTGGHQSSGSGRGHGRGSGKSEGWGQGVAVHALHCHPQTEERSTMSLEGGAEGEHHKGLGTPWGDRLSVNWEEILRSFSGVADDPLLGGGSVTASLTGGGASAGSRAQGVAQEAGVPPSTSGAVSLSLDATDAVTLQCNGYNNNDMDGTNCSDSVEDQGPFLRQLAAGPQSDSVTQSGDSRDPLQPLLRQLAAEPHSDGVTQSSDSRDPLGFFLQQLAAEPLPDLCLEDLLPWDQDWAATDDVTLTNDGPRECQDGTLVDEVWAGGDSVTPAQEGWSGSDTVTLANEGWAGSDSVTLASQLRRDCGGVTLASDMAQGSDGSPAADAGARRGSEGITSAEEVTGRDSDAVTPADEGTRRDSGGNIPQQHCPSVLAGGSFPHSAGHEKAASPHGLPARSSLAARLASVLRDVSQQAAGKKHKGTPQHGGGNRDTPGVTDLEEDEQWSPGSHRRVLGHHNPIPREAPQARSSSLVPHNHRVGMHSAVEALSPHVTVADLTPPVSLYQSVAQSCAPQGEGVSEWVPPFPLLLRPPLPSGGPLSPLEAQCLEPAYRRQLMHQLLRLGTAYATDQQESARKQLGQLRRVASVRGVFVQRLLYYILAGLASRFEGRGRGEPQSLLPPPEMLPSIVERMQGGVHEAYGRFAELVMNGELKRVLGPLGPSARVHILVLTTWLCPDWGDLFGFLARRGHAPASVRVTIVVPTLEASCPQVQREYLCLGHQVVSAARAQGLRVACRLTVVSPRDFHPSLVRADPCEAVAVVSWMALHALPDAATLRHNPRDATLKFIRDLRPLTFVLIEVDASYNSPFFVARFTELVQKSFAIFGLLNAPRPAQSTFLGSNGDPRQPDGGLSPLFELKIGLELMNIISCEGLDRSQRAETLAAWEERLQRAGLQHVPLEEEYFGAMKSELLPFGVSLENVRGSASLRRGGSPLVFVGKWGVNDKV